MHAMYNVPNFSKLYRDGTNPITEMVDEFEKLENSARVVPDDIRITRLRRTFKFIASKPRQKILRPGKEDSNILKKTGAI